MNTGKYGPEITPYLDTFHAVIGIVLMIFFSWWFTVMNKYKETEAQNMLICAAVRIKKKISNSLKRILICHSNIAQKMKFSIKDFFSKCHQIHRKLRIWSHLLKKSLMENFNFYAV